MFASGIAESLAGPPLDNQVEKTRRGAQVSLGRTASPSGSRTRGARLVGQALLRIRSVRWPQTQAQDQHCQICRGINPEPEKIKTRKASSVRRRKERNHPERKGQRWNAFRRMGAKPTFIALHVCSNPVTRLITSPSPAPATLLPTPGPARAWARPMRVSFSQRGSRAKPQLGAGGHPRGQTGEHKGPVFFGTGIQLWLPATDSGCRSLIVGLKRAYFYFNVELELAGSGSDVLAPFFWLGYPRARGLRVCRWLRVRCSRDKCRTII